MVKEEIKDRSKSALLTHGRGLILVNYSHDS